MAVDVPSSKGPQPSSLAFSSVTRLRHSWQEAFKTKADPTLFLCWQALLRELLQLLIEALRVSAFFGLSSLEVWTKLALVFALVSCLILHSSSSLHGKSTRPSNDMLVSRAPEEVIRCDRRSQRGKYDYRGPTSIPHLPKPRRPPKHDRSFDPHWIPENLGQTSLSQTFPNSQDKQS